MTQEQDTHDVRTTRVCRFDKECWLDTKHNDSTIQDQPTIEDVSELVVADWGNAVDAAFRFTNQAFNGYPSNGLNVRGQLWGSRSGSNVTLTDTQPAIIDLIRFENITPKSQLYITATIVGVDMNCPPTPKKVVIEHHGVVCYDPDAEAPQPIMLFRSTEYHEVYSAVATNAGACLKIADFPDGNGEKLLAAEVWGDTQMQWHVDYHARQLPELVAEQQYVQEGDCVPPG